VTFRRKRFSSGGGGPSSLDVENVGMVKLFAPGATACWRPGATPVPRRSTGHLRAVTSRVEGSHLSDVCLQPKDRVPGGLLAAGTTAPVVRSPTQQANIARAGSSRWVSDERELVLASEGRQVRVGEDASVPGWVA